MQAQSTDGSDMPVSSTSAVPPLLWMPHGPAGPTQQGLQQDSIQRTGSASTGHRSVNKLHGLKSPPEKKISSLHATTQARSHAPRQKLSNNHALAADASELQGHMLHADAQQPAYSNACWQSSPHPSQVTRPEQSHTLLLQQHTLHGSSAQQQAEDNQQAISQPRQQRTDAASAGANAPAHASSRAEPVQKLNGVRMVKGGWEARFGNGRTKVKQSLGIHSTGDALD